MIHALIITEGSSRIGFGHITRCISLAQALQAKGVRVSMAINGDANTRHLLAGWDAEIFDWMKSAGKLSRMISDADIAIIDSYLAPRTVYGTLANKVPVPLYIDDFKRLKYPRGYVLNGTIFAEKMRYPRTKGTTYLTGVRYIPLRTEFWTGTEKRIHTAVREILITFGGDDTRGLTPEMMKAVEEIYPTAQKSVIIGKGFRNIPQIRKVADFRTRLIYHPDAEGMKRAMRNADLAVSAGGQTLFELASSGVPTVGVMVAENQEHNVKGWQKCGFLEFGGSYTDNRLPLRVRSALRRMANSRRRERSSIAGRTFCDGRGSERVARELIHKAYAEDMTLRRAERRDAKKIFELSNDRAVRQQSFSSKKIRWDDHITWFYGKRVSPDCAFYIIESKGEFIGQVRFETEPGKGAAIISTSIMPQFRGLGLAACMLDAAVQRFASERKEIAVILAYVKNTNIASRKAFEKAGFRLRKRLKVNGLGSRLYERKI